ncbi:ATP--guanido phosphotransferase [Engelhardtia mirabilis]|uniref:ATP--guanido phosphotransferase n=1 Tax=Engelhardtia mirabilis TaxID=2528011 RepID=UPI003AF358D7
MTLQPIRIDEFAHHVGSWLVSPGPESDVVVSCRVRLARNLSAFPFVTRLADDKAALLAKELRAALTDLSEGGPAGEAASTGDGTWVDIPKASSVARLLLRERHLVSRDLAPIEEQRRVPAGRAVFFAQAETVSAMVNEEDHLRLQGFAGGFDLGLAWQRVRELDQGLEGRVDFAVSERLGYLTACPTNVGTGMRASVMLHLPALGLVRAELEKVFAAAQRTGLAVRGMYGEGTRAAGDLYQISNQVTLGRSEPDLIGDLESLVPCIVDFERRVRKSLMDERRSSLEERVERSLGMLCNAKTMPTDVALMHLSNLRLGSCLGLFDRVQVQELNGLAVQIQRGHIQVRSVPTASAALLDARERDQLRATFLRERFADGGGSAQ